MWWGDQGRGSGDLSPCGTGSGGGSAEYGDTSTVGYFEKKTSKTIYNTFCDDNHDDNHLSHLSSICKSRVLGKTYNRLSYGSKYEDTIEFYFSRTPLPPQKV